MYKNPNEIADVPEARDSTWEEWEQTVMWQQTTVPGLLLEEPTRPQPLELLPMDKH